MKCEYKDGYKVNYSGSLSIRKGEEVDLYVKESFIPSSVKGAFDAAALHNSCSELRMAARKVTDTIHGDWYKE